MAVGDGVVWAEALPDNTTLASEIDDYDRDLRVGVRSRMALEHVWPAAHTGTGSGGRHTYITFQAQTAAPTMAGTTGGGLYVSTEVSPRLIFTRSNGTDVTIVNTAGNIPIVSGGTQGGVVIASSANANGTVVLAGSADGFPLVTHSNTGAPTWEKLAGAGTVDTSALTGSTYLPDATVDTTALKTANAEYSDASSAYTMVAVTGGEYCFWPQTKMNDTTARGWCVDVTHSNGITSVAGWAAYATKVGLYNGGAGTVYAQFRYVTASAIDFWLWLLIDKLTGKILTRGASPDATAYGNGGDFDALPHPFLSFKPYKHDIILVEKYQAKEIQKLAVKSRRSVLTLLEQEYSIDFNKRYEYDPIHSGQFSPDHKPVLVERIPEYVQVRKLKHSLN